MTEPATIPEAERPTLSARDEDILEFVRRYSNARGFPPTVREIGKAIGLSSPSAAAAVIDRLIGLGVLRRTPKVPRSLVVVEGDVL